MADRRPLAAVVLVLALATAGCGFLLGQESLAFAAEPTTVEEATLEETGYEEADVSAQTQNRTFEVAGQNRTVQVTNQVAQYDKAVDLGPFGSQRAAVFTVLTTPEVTVAGQGFNPVADMDSRDLVRRVANRDSRIEAGQLVESRDATVLGQETTVDTFDGTLTVAGQGIDIYIHITKVKHEGDYVVATALYPQRVDDSERENADALLLGLQHDGEE